MNKYEAHKICIARSTSPNLNRCQSLQPIKYTYMCMCVFVYVRACLVHIGVHARMLFSDNFAK